MRDEETGSWRQQVTGEAILGPLKGRRLRPVFHDELTFGTWKRERPGGRVLRPAPGPKNRYAPANWEEEVSKLPVVSPIDPKSPLPPRAVVAGLTFGGESRAYPLTALKRQNPILDRLGDIPILGYLFGSTQDIVLKTELMIMVTPRLVLDPGEAKSIYEDFKRRAPELRREMERPDAPVPPISPFPPRPAAPQSLAPGPGSDLTSR